MQAEKLFLSALGREHILLLSNIFFHKILWFTWMLSSKTVLLKRDDFPHTRFKFVIRELGISTQEKKNEYVLFSPTSKSKTKLHNKKTVFVG